MIECFEFSDGNRIVMGVETVNDLGIEGIDVIEFYFDGFVFVTVESFDLFWNIEEILMKFSMGQKSIVNTVQVCP